MTFYLITRRGSNGANQPVTLAAPVAIVEANDCKAAVEAASRSIKCYANQRLVAKPASRAARWELEEAACAEENRAAAAVLAEEISEQARR